MNTIQARKNQKTKNVSYWRKLCHQFDSKILNNQELQQVSINNLSDIDFKDFMNLCKNDTTIGSDNLLRFRQNFLVRKAKLIMTIDDKIRYKKSYNIR